MDGQATTDKKKKRIAFGKSFVWSGALALVIFHTLELIVSRVQSIARTTNPMFSMQCCIRHGMDYNQKPLNVTQSAAWNIASAILFFGRRYWVRAREGKTKTAVAGSWWWAAYAAISANDNWIFHKSIWSCRIRLKYNCHWKIIEWCKETVNAGVVATQPDSHSNHTKNDCAISLTPEKYCIFNDTVVDWKLSGV